MTPPGLVSYTITGTFGSSTSASGNLIFNGPPCTGNATATWSAAKGTGFRLTVFNYRGETFGTGTVTSSPAGINCGADCTEVYASAVTLAATPSDGSFFAGRRSGCTGTGACALPMTASTFVEAVFGLLPADLVTAGVNQAEFRTGDQIITSLALNNPDHLSPLSEFLLPPVAAEFYIGLLLPDGDTIAFFAPSGTVLGRASDLGSFVALATGVSLASSFSVSVPNFFTYQWSGTEPAGTYKFFIVAVHAGALADRVVNPGDILTVKVVSFTFQP